MATRRAPQHLRSRSNSREIFAREAARVYTASGKVGARLTQPPLAVPGPSVMDYRLRFTEFSGFRAALHIAQKITGESRPALRGDR